MRNQENNNYNNAKIRKFRDTTQNDGRRNGGNKGGGKGGGGSGRGGGGGKGSRFMGSEEQRFRGFRNGQDGGNNQYPTDKILKPGVEVFNEFKGINNFTYAYEIKNKPAEVLPSKPSNPLIVAPPSYLEVSNQLETKIESKIIPPKEEKPKTPVAAIKKEQNSDIKSIKIEKANVPLVKAEQKPKAAKLSSSDSSTNSSSESSSSEEEVPAMPKPMKTTPKSKKECEAEDEVICLGKRSNFENLDGDDDDVKHCRVCKSEEHTGGKCQMNCIKCSHSSYSTHVICNNCGETYPPKATPPNAPNPFLMFMQFMQFCMSQYTDMSKEMLPEQIKKEVEIPKKEISETKSHHKKSKSESKQIRKKNKKLEKSTDSDSDSSSKATASIRKRKKSESVQPNTPVVKSTHQSKQIRKKKKSVSSSDSDSDSSTKPTASVKKRKKPDNAQPTPPIVQPIRKKKKPESSTTDSDSDSDSSTKTAASAKKRNKPDVQPTPPVKQPTHQAKQLRKKRKSTSSSDSDSDSSSKATVPVKKRKKEDTEQQKPQVLPQFPAAFPNNMPFAGGFSNTGFNPMLAFSQMMGFNPKTMNFPK